MRRPHLNTSWLTEPIFTGFQTSYYALGLFRVFFAFTLLCILKIPGFEWLSRAQDFMYNPPPGLASLFGQFPPDSILWMLDMGILCCILGIGIGWKTPWWSVLLTALYWLGKSWEYSLGKIDHGGLLFVIPLLLAWHWGRAFSLDARKQPTFLKLSTSWPIALCACIVGFAYFSAAVPKLYGGWLDTDFSMFRNFMNVQYYNLGRQDLLAPMVINIQSGIFWELMDWLAVAFEFGFLIAVLKPKLFRLFCVIALIFHLSVLLILNISFINNGPLLMLFLLAPLISVEKSQNIPVWIVVLIAAGVVANVIGLDTSLANFSRSLGVTRIYALVMITLFVALGVISLVVKSGDLSPDRTSLSPVKSPARIMGGMALLMGVLFAQFGVTATIAEPYPGILMPSFASTSFRSGEIVTSRTALRLYCPDESYQDISANTLFAGLPRNTKARNFNRLYFDKDVRPPRNSVDRKITAHCGHDVSAWIQRLRNRPLSPEDRVEFEQWTRQRIAVLTHCPDVERVEAIRERTIRNRENGQIVNQEIVQQKQLEYAMPSLQ